MIWKRLLQCLRTHNIRWLLKRNNLTGYAVVEKDTISGNFRWVTYDAKGTDRFAYDPGDPLIIYPDKLRVESVVEMFEKAGR